MRLSSLILLAVAVVAVRAWPRRLRHGHKDAEAKSSVIWNEFDASGASFIEPDDACDVLLCGGSGVGKSTLMRYIKAGAALNHTCPPPPAWSAFVHAYHEKLAVVRHIDTCNLPCSGCGRTRIKLTADRAAIVRHWSDRVTSGFKGGLGYALQKTMWRCSFEDYDWGRPAASRDDYDLHVNVDIEGRYCVRTGREASPRGLRHHGGRLRGRGRD